MGTFDTAGKEVAAAQFFDPTPFYPGDDSLMKLYRFSVYDGGEVSARYYLECSNLQGDYYVLGRSDATSGAHSQVQPYAKKPTYWELRARVIEDLGGTASTRAED